MIVIVECDYPAQFLRIGKQRQVRQKAKITNFTGSITVVSELVKFIMNGNDATWPGLNQSLKIAN